MIKEKVKKKKKDKKAGKRNGIEKFAAVLLALLLYDPPEKQEPEFAGSIKYAKKREKQRTKDLKDVKITREGATAGTWHINISKIPNDYIDEVKSGIENFVNSKKQLKNNVKVTFEANVKKATWKGNLKGIPDHWIDNLEVAVLDIFDRKKKETKQ